MRRKDGVATAAFNAVRIRKSQNNNVKKEISTTIKQEEIMQKHKYVRIIPVPKDGAAAAVVDESGEVLPKVKADVPDVTDVDPKEIAAGAAVEADVLLPKVNAGALEATAGVLALATPKLIASVGAAVVAAVAFGTALAVRHVSHSDALGLFMDSQHAQIGWTHPILTMTHEF